MQVDVKHESTSAADSNVCHAGAVTPTESNESKISAGTIAADSKTSHVGIAAFVGAIWRDPGSSYFISTFDQRKRKFENHAVTPVNAELVASAFSTLGLDVYFAFAGFASPDNRTAANATSCFTFVADIDCGENKVLAGKGYADVDAALEAVAKFCVMAKLPPPTHIVESGSGLHVYWVYGQPLSREQWISYAKKLKAVMAAVGFLADPARTADIAGVLRVPGTLNHKTVPPKPVTLRSAAATYLSQCEVLDAIDAAYAIHCPDIVSVELEPASTPAPALSAHNMDGYSAEPPNLLRLASALKVLNPDCDEYTWVFHRIAPMANASVEFPEIAERLYQMTKEWSSGALRGNSSQKWNTPGSNGLTGAQYFDRVWNRFLKGNYGKRKATLATIFYHAKEAGWDYYAEQRKAQIAEDEAGQ